MAGTSNKEKVISLLASRRHSNRALILGLSSIVLLMAGGYGYILFEFHRVATNAATEISTSSSRNSLLSSVYQIALESYNLGEQAVRTPRDIPSLKPIYEKAVDSFKTTKNQYIRLLEMVPVKPTGLQNSVNDFFTRSDTLFSRTGLLFNTKLSPFQRLDLPKEARSLFEPGINDYFRRLRQSREALMRFELDLSMQEFLDARNSTRLAAEQWFAVSGLLFAFALVLAIVVIVLARRATSLMAQFSAVLAHNVNPIEITDSTGKIVYVNSEFERWTGVSRSALIGSNGFDALTLQNGQERGQSAWEHILAFLQKGESWSGEVEVHHRNGNVAVSSFVVLPVRDQQGKLQEIVGLHHDTTEKRRIVRKAEEMRDEYQSLVESSLDGIVVVQDQKLAFVNPAAVRIFEYDSQEDMKRLSFIDTIAPASRPFLRLEDLEKSPGEDLLKNYEMKGLTKNGKLIDLEINARVIVWNGRKAMHASFRNITERKALERLQAVWLWEQETLSSIDRQLVGIVDLQKVLDIILEQAMLLTRCQFVAVVMVDVESRQGHWRAAKGNKLPLVGNVIKLTSDGAAKLTGRDHFVQEDCRSGEYFSISHLPDLGMEEIVSAGFFPLLVSGEPRGKLVAGFRQAHKFGDRESRVLVSMAEKVSIALTNGELYENLLHREKELELLSGARVQAQEEERRRISREIHDGLGQLLTAIKFNLEILEDSIPVQEETGKRIDEVKQLLDNVMKEAREISYNLMPSVLDDFGLGPGLQSLCEQFSKGTGLIVSFHEHGLTERLSADMEIGLYRIAQEALNNIAKHAAAKEVEIQIVRHANKLQMTIEDNGKGMEVALPARKPTGSGGTGLVGMRERAASFRGTLLIDSTPGKGTMISIEVPLTARG